MSVSAYAASDPLAAILAYAEGVCESPIEFSLFQSIVRTRREQMKVGVDIDDMVNGFAGGLVKISLALQAKIDPYRVDFLLLLNIGRDIEGLVIECDGHDWHDRTKEQAGADRSKDRALQRAGFDVFRFTGREIWRDADGCAAEIFEWVDARRGARA